MPTLPADPAALHAALQRWFRDHRRDMPWVDAPTPYAIWIAVVMLQQTQLVTVAPYFQRWMQRFPHVEALAEAALDDVLKQWQGLGYYARARNIHRAARQLVAEHGGALPREAEALMTLPGIGRYSAGAIASIAFGKRAAALDGNLKRIFARLTLLERSINSSAGDRELWQIAEALLPTAAQAGDWNEALMDLGALVCTSRNPHCGACPFQPHCLAFAHGLQDELPRRKASKARPHYIVTAGVIWDAAGDQLLVAQRPTEGMLGGLWEFPGGKQETGETLQAALRRELREEMAIEVAVGDELVVIDHAYTHFSITLHAFHCTHIGGEPQRLGVADFRWLHPDELAQLAWPSTDQRILEALLSEKRNGNAERVTQSQEN